MAVGLEEGTRTGAVGNRRDAGFGIEPRIGVERHALDLGSSPRDSRGVAADAARSALRRPEVGEAGGEEDRSISSRMPGTSQTLRRSPVAGAPQPAPGLRPG